jgi:sulfur-oxidizing protein SoxY
MADKTDEPDATNASHEPDRRAVLAGAAALGAAGFLPPSVALADDGPSAAFAEAYDALLAGRKPAPKGVLFDVPEIAENGNTVPFVVGVESPMTEADNVRTLHVLSTANPQAVLARFSFTPASGKAQVTGRIRLARSQDVLVAKTAVKVTIGGCGG